MKKLYKTDIQEQETLVHIDYFNKMVTLYTSSEGTYNKCLEKLGNPSKTYFIKNKICGGSWEVPFEDIKRSGYIFSRPLLIGRRK